MCNRVGEESLHCSGEAAQYWQEVGLREACESCRATGESQEAVQVDSCRKLDLICGRQFINVFIKKVPGDMCFALCIDIWGDAFKNIQSI